MSAETNVGLLDLSAPIVLYTELRRFPALQVFVCVSVCVLHAHELHSFCCVH